MRTSASTGQQLTLGFTQVDFNEEEGIGSVMARVQKTGTNVGDLVVTVTPLTYDEFDAMNFTQPPEVPRPLDPAECKYFEQYSELHNYVYIVILQCCCYSVVFCVHFYPILSIWSHVFSAQSYSIGTCLW